LVTIFPLTPGGFADAGLALTAAMPMAMAKNTRVTVRRISPS
jgi:hypothetical protein